MPVQIQDFALTIGLNDYPQYIGLNGPIEDAKRFHEWVLDSDNGGGVAKEHARFIPSEIDGNRLSPNNYDIDDALTELIDVATALNGNARRLYFYFSGHGLGLTANEVGLCLPSWSKKKRGRSLLVNEYLDDIQQYGVFKEICFFLDCCRVTAVNAEGVGFSAPPPKANENAGKAQYLIGFATEFQDKAWEAEMQVEDGERPQIRGFFTTALLEGLKGAAALPEGGVSLTNLASYVEMRIPELFAKDERFKTYKQEPRFRVEPFSAGNRIILGSALPGNKILIGGPEETSPSSSPLESIKPTPLLYLRGNFRREMLITLFDETHQERYRGFDESEVNLPAGTYTIHVKYYGKTLIHVHQHVGPESTFYIPEPEVFTSTPLAGASSSHKYYTYPAEKWSRNLTHAVPINGDNSGLFVFGRYPNQELARDTGQTPFEFFELLNDRMEVVHSLRQGSSPYYSETGWQAFSAKIGAGQYYLCWKSKTTTVIPVYLFPDWQTQLFLTYSEGKPVFPSLRLSMARSGVGFNGRFQNDDSRISDLAFNCLMDVNIPLPPDVLERLLYGKFENPVFGLLGAYLLLQRPDLQADNLLQRIFGRDKVTKQDAIERVTINMRRLLNVPDSPDWLIFKSMTTDAPVQPIELAHPPMFAFGTELVIKQKDGIKVQITPGSVFQKMIPYRRADIALTSWEMPPEAGDMVTFLDTPGEHAPQWVTSFAADLIWRAQKQGTALTLAQIAASMRLPEDMARMALIDISKKPVAEVFDLANDEASRQKLTKNVSQLISTGKMEQTKKAKVFIISAPQDTQLLKELIKTAIKPLLDEGLITQWNFDNLIPGEITMQVAGDHFDKSDLFVGLISADYFNDENFAMVFHRKVLDRNLLFIPVLAKPYLYTIKPELAGNMPIPRDQNNKPMAISLWNDQNEAFIQISEGILQTVQTKIYKT